MTKLGFYKTHPSIPLPSFATKGSACFDLACNTSGKYEYKGYNSQNKEFTRQVHADGKVYINPGDRILVPTGLVMDIPEGYSVRIHARSGTSLKRGLVLINAEGIIDSDYVEEIFLLIHNTSDNGQYIERGERIAQAELIKTETYEFEEVDRRPIMKSQRVGGMGSTGLSVEVLSYNTTAVAETPLQPTSTVQWDPNNPNNPPVTLTEQAPVKRGRGRPRKVA